MVLFTSLSYFLDSIYKWKHTVFVFLCLTDFTKPNTLQFHPCCCKWQNFIIFYGQVVFFYIYIYIYIYIYRICILYIIFEYIFYIYIIYIYIYIIYIFHSSVDGRLGCFYLLGIMNNAALNFSVQISVQVPAFNSFEYILWSGLAGSYANFMFNFLRNCHPFSTVATPFHISISIAQGLQFLHILANTYLLALFVFVFDYGHLNGYSPFFKIYFSYC